MPNLMDYLDWRGELTFAQAPFNQVDGLILAQFAYVALDGLVPGNDRLPASRPLGEAATKLLAHGQDIHQTGYMWKDNRRLAEALINARRFGSLGLMGYESCISSDEATQFAAMTYLLPDGSAAVAFRGTDDTLVGWKEDLALSFDSPVPAQEAAAAYLQAVAAAYPGPLRVMGHSKGGNLAVYAAAMAEEALQKRIVSLINYDGPGMDPRTLQSPGYQRIRERMDIYFPHFAVVGMLLEHEETYRLVQSSATAIMQHDAFSWQVLGPTFRFAQAPSPVSLATNQVIKAWLSTLSPTERKLFTDTVYDIATAGGDENLSQLESNWRESLKAILRKTRSLDPEIRSVFHKQLLALFATAVKSLFRLPQRKEETGEAEHREKAPQ